MTLIDLYDYADSNDYAVYHCGRLRKKAACMMHENQDYILLNLNKLPTEAEERQVLAEEIGHCQYNAFYYLDAQSAQVSWAESRARRWAVQALMPFEDLRKAYAKADTLTDMAEFLEVDEDFIMAAVNYYEQRGLLLKHRQTY